MKQKLIEAAIFILFLVPMLLILGSPVLQAQAQGMDQSVARHPSAPFQATFYGMNGLYDGWVLESGEFTGVGGSLNSSSGAITLGDDAKNRQYRGIISFTTRLPYSASIQSATLYLTGIGVVGRNPFIWGDLQADIKKGFFGTTRFLQLGDFQARANFVNAGIQASCASTGRCTVPLVKNSFSYINRWGLTQFRLRFTPDDNNNRLADYYKMISGDSVANKPVLVVEYYP